jgi:hypothetical protein
MWGCKETASVSVMWEEVFAAWTFEGTFLEKAPIWSICSTECNTLYLISLWYYCVEGYAYFPKVQEPLPNFRHQRGNVKQANCINYTENVWCHHRNFWSPRWLLPRICGHLTVCWKVEISILLVINIYSFILHSLWIMLCVTLCSFTRVL